MEIKITKKVVIDSGEDSAYSYAYKYYLVYGKLYNDEKTRYRPFKYVMRIWKEDIFEAENYPDYLPLYRQKEITEDILYSFIECNYPKSYNECKNFFDACRESIALYNSAI